MTIEIERRLPVQITLRRLVAVGAVLVAGVMTVLPVSAVDPSPAEPSPAEPSPAALSPAAPSPPSGSGVATPLVVGLGYIPSVQFAQFYYADAQGYYRDAGLDVTFQNQPDPQLIVLLGQGAVDLGIGDGTSVIPAVSQGIPVRYAATIYAKFPAVVFAKASAGITTPADLAGKRLGTPGQFGTSWIMLQALLASAGLTTDDLTISLYPDYTQGVAVSQDLVDAATGFINNEPVQLQLQGETVDILRVDDITPLPGPGLVVGNATLASKGDALKAFVEGTLRAMDEIAADPQLGLDATFERVPELASDPALQRAILDATIDTWSSPYTEQNGLGAIDSEAWQASVDFLMTLPDGPLPDPVSVDQLITQELLPQR
jgi:NitT/TauT family transport system substrate-binding protein